VSPTGEQAIEEDTMQATTKTSRPQAFRLLVISNETVASGALKDAIVGIAAGRRATVTVVAPALNGRVRHWLSDEDLARRAAQERIERCLEGLRDNGVPATGRVGDADPLLAIEDALRDSGADELLIATHPEQRSNWLAHDLVERAVARFGVPTAHLVVDLRTDDEQRRAPVLAAA
jgi:hypothetical protein